MRMITLTNLLSPVKKHDVAAWKMESMVTPVFATLILMISWLA